MKNPKELVAKLTKLENDASDDPALVALVCLFKDFIIEVLPRELDRVKSEIASDFTGHDNSLN